MLQVYIQFSGCVTGGDDDVVLWNDSEEDGNVRSECEEDEWH